MPALDDLLVQAAKKGGMFGVCGQKEHVSVQAGKTIDIGNVELKIQTKLKPRK